MTETLQPLNSLTLYQQYRSQMKSGDVIAFSGRAGFSALIKLLTGSPYSHVGMVLQDQSALFGEILLLVESTTEVRLSDADGRQAIKGVQIHFLSQRLATYDGSAFLVPLKSPIPTLQLQQMVTWLSNIYVEKVPYSYARVWDIPLAKIEDAFGKETKLDYSSLFCSELVTRALQVGGIIDLHLDPTSQTPANVVSFNCFDQPVMIKEDSSLKPDIMSKAPTT